MPKKDPPQKAYGSLFIGVLAVSTAAILIKLALPSASALAISFYRMLFSSLFALLIYQSGKEKIPLSSICGQQKLLLILAGFFLALHFVLWTWSLELLSVSSSVFFVTTTPLWVGLFTPLVFKEKVSSRFYWGVLVAIIGGLIIATRQGGSPTGASNRSSTVGLFMALAGAWMASAYFMIGKKLSSQLPTKFYVTIVYSISSLVLGIFLIFEQRGGFILYDAKTYLYFLLMAAIPQTLGHTSFNTALKHLPAATVSLALLFEPVGSTILAIFFLQEMPATAEIVGGIFILIGLITAIKPKAKPLSNAA